MQRNLTVTIDERVLREARKIAIDRNTSVNRLVREYLTELVGDKERTRSAVADLDEIFRTTRYKIGDRKWTRDELHERT